MSYNIGQFRKDMLSDNGYITPLSYTQGTIDAESDTILNINVRDRVLSIPAGLNYGQNYFLRVGVVRTDLKQEINIILKNTTGGASDISQNITTVVVPPLDNTQNTVAIIEVVLSPNSAYDQILLQLRRSLTDITTTEDFQKLMQAVVEIYPAKTQVGEIVNILNQIGSNSLYKIGIQGPSGLLMCINGEEIRIGPNGIYEIKNGYKITFIGFVILSEDSDNNYFILDYQY